SMAKLYASEVAVRVANETVQIFGGYGVIKGYPGEKFYRDVKLTTIGEGTSEVQRIVIARQILGKGKLEKRETHGGSSGQMGGRDSHGRCAVDCACYYGYRESRAPRAGTVTDLVFLDRQGIRHRRNRRGRKRQEHVG